MLPKECSSTDAWRSVARAAYADDVALWAIARPQSCAVARVQSELDRIEKWTSKWRLRLNPSKCEAITIDHNRRKVTCHLTIGGQRLEWQKVVKYLGCYITAWLGWKQHMDEVLKRANQRTAALRAMLAPPAKISDSLALTFYQGIVRPLAEYGAPVTIGMCQSQLHRLAILEKKTLKAILGLHQRTPTVLFEHQLALRLPQAVPIEERLVNLAVGYGMERLRSSEVIGNLIRACHDAPNDGSNSPARIFLRLCGPMPINILQVAPPEMPILVPVAGDGAVPRPPCPSC